MNSVDIKDKYREETNKDVYSSSAFEEEGSYSDEYVKWLEGQVSKLPIHGVSCSALDDLKKQLEIEKEDKERNEDNMFISTFQDGKVRATEKAIDILEGYCN